MIIKYVQFKFIPGKMDTKMDVINEMDRKSYKILKMIIDLLKEDEYRVGGKRKDKICEHFNISESTYYRKIKQLNDLGVLIKEETGIYKVNKNWLEVFKVDLK